MSILEVIKSAHIDARKNKDSLRSSLLSTIIGDIEQSQDRSDAVVVAKLQSFERKLNEAAKLYESKNKDAYETSLKEIEIVKSFLPKQLTDEEIQSIIAENNLTNIKDAMVFFKANYLGRFKNGDVAALFQK